MLEIIFVSLLQVAAGEPAETATTPEATPAQGEVTAEEARRRERNMRRCRRETVVGSRLPARVCNSDADMEMLGREARDFFHDIQQGGLEESDLGP